MIPEEIDPISPLRDLIIAGRYLSSADEGVIIGEELADLMKVGVGDEMILLGAHPETGLGVLKVPILGIYSAPAAAWGERSFKPRLLLPAAWREVARRQPLSLCAWPTSMDRGTSGASTR